MSEVLQPLTIKAIIGLGNPGKQYYHNRHNIGFRVLDSLCQSNGGSWQTKDNMEYAEITLNNHKIMLIKPQTYMNSSGKVIPFLQKKGVMPAHLLVVHDELELPFGSIKLRVGGSAKGHNGLKSIIQAWGPDFARLRVGIGRPAEREEVPDYVLQDFTENAAQINQVIEQAEQEVRQLL